MRKTYGDIHTAQGIINMMNVIILEDSYCYRQKHQVKDLKIGEQLSRYYNDW